MAGLSLGNAHDYLVYLVDIRHGGLTGNQEFVGSSTLRGGGGPGASPAPSKELYSGGCIKY